MSDSAARPLNDTAPCIGCGLCCNGTLYRRAKVAPGEESTLLAHGLTVVTEEERSYFRLPCHHERCGRCTIYEERFEICRSFRCALLRRYQSGEIDLPAARATVEKAFELLAAVKADDPATGLYVERRRVREQLAQRIRDLGADDRASAGRRLLNIIALDSYIERWFLNKKEDSPDADSNGSNS